ncbi:T cell receptor alpha chain MC.7.G5-like, partial [Lampris incognitus]|uniref:T cell receptor alpha chain MC.7.G5-like n=1 Tax=Lampris incognitus TaxID=2546036 RepID=UPI0024B4D915
RAQKDNVLQPKGGVTVSEGETVTLDIHYNTSPSLYWYRQAADDKPTFIRRPYSYGSGDTEDGFEERSDSSLDPSSRPVPLKIQSLQLSDSAVYYCALRPKSGDKLHFGRGTKLIVDTEDNYEPSYYLLSVSNDTQACLATDFTSYKATQDVFGNAAEATRPDEDSFYSQVALFPPGTLNCTEPEETCDADIFEPDEKVNFLALVMQGLRLIFIKTVVFNVLMMLQLWRSYTQYTDGSHGALSP